MARARASIVVLAAFALAASARATLIEALRGDAGTRFMNISLGATTAAPPVEGAPVAEPVISRPALIALPEGRAEGPLLGEFTLAERLDTHRDLLPLQLGAGLWNVSAAGDSKLEATYLAFQKGTQLQLHRIKDLNEFRGDGVVVRLDKRTAYRFKVQINIFSPVRDSTLHVEPVSGTSGPRHSRRTGEVLDAVKRESFVFHASGKEYWVLYGTDVDPATDQLASTRSLLFINEADTNSKAWPVGEGSLETGKPVSVALGDTQVVLVRTGEGKLRIHGGGGAGAAPSAH